MSGATTGKGPDTTLKTVDMPLLKSAKEFAVSALSEITSVNISAIETVGRFVQTIGHKVTRDPKYVQNMGYKYIRENAPHNCALFAKAKAVSENGGAGPVQNKCDGTNGGNCCEMQDVYWRTRQYPSCYKYC